jgi:hypothetical protein
MTHLEEFVRVLDLMGIEYETEAHNGQTTITIRTGEGYAYFYGEFVFDPDGKFKYHALWE